MGSRSYWVNRAVAKKKQESADVPREGKAKVRPAKRRSSRKKQPNATEKRYMEWLDARLADGSVQRWSFQSVKLKLANNTWFEPDFWVIDADGSVCIDDVK